MDGRYNFSRQHSGVWMCLRDEDFEEEEIWSVLKHSNTTDRPGLVAKSQEQQHSSPVPVPVLPRPLSTSAARMIPRPNSNNHGNRNRNQNRNAYGDEGNSENEGRLVHQLSAPVNIPDWSKVYKQKPKNSSKIVGDVDYDVEVEDDPSNCDDGDEHEGDYSYRIPPHEYVARRMARSYVSNSVFEGVGRTLKGRDLCKLRNTILTKTGFLESL